MKQITEIDDPRLVKGLAHPLRVHILRVLENQTASPNQIADKLGAPLGNVSYHVRFLARVGLIEQVRTEPRRGAVEHFYRSVGRVRVTNKAWAQVPDVVKRSLVAATLTQIGDVVSASAAMGGFDRKDAVMSRRSVILDRQGFSDLANLCREFLGRAEQVERQSARRLKDTGDHDGESSTGIVLLLFESSGSEPKKESRSTRRPRRALT